jgi:ankyrin repeat protein
MNSGANNIAEDNNGRTPREVVALPKEIGEAKRRWNLLKTLVKTLAVGRRDLFKAVDLQDEALITSLLEKGVSYTEENKENEMPIHRAVKNRLLKSLEILVCWKDSVNLTNSEGKTPLHFAILQGWPEGIDLLMVNGADIGAKTAEGDTALHLAAATGNLPLLDELLILPQQVAILHSFPLLPYAISIYRKKNNLILTYS